MKKSMKSSVCFIAICLSLVTLASCAHRPAATTSVDSVNGKASTGFDAELSNYTYPFPVKFYSFRAQEQDLKMAYMDENSQSEKTIVLFHGKNFTGAYFEEFAKALVDKGYRVIIPDQIGFGKSTKPVHFQYSIHGLALYTQQLLGHLGVKKFEVLGHSMGGMIATRISLMFPGQVQKLFLINPIGLEDWKTMTSYRGIDEAFKGELAATAEKIKKYQIENYYDGQWKPEYEKWVVVPQGWLVGPDFKLIAWNAALTFDMIFTQPVVYEFKNLKMPTILLIGAKDRTALGKAWASPEMKKKMGNYPQLGRQVAKLIPRSQLIEMKNVGHLPFIEDFSGFMKVLSPALTK